MKIFYWISMLILVLGVAPSRLAAQGSNAGKNTLTNQDVVDLVKTGLSDDVVVAKIKGSSNQFDTSTSALKDLKSAGVSDAVILAMVQAPGKTADTAGSASVSSSTASSSDSAHVRVYRPHQVPGGGFYPPISIDDKVIAKLSNGRRFSIRVTPGAHVITSDDKTSAISIDAKPGQEFYVSVQELPGGFLKGRGKMTLVAVEQGKPEYKLAKPLEEERKIEKDMVESDADASN
jgi:hypothetical protein